MAIYTLTTSQAPDAKPVAKSFTLSTNWQNPIFDITSRLPYAVTAITQIEEEWSA